MGYAYSNQTLQVIKEDKEKEKEAKQSYLNITIFFNLLTIVIGAIMNTSNWVVIPLILSSWVLLLVARKTVKVEQPYDIYEYFFHLGLTAKKVQKVEWKSADDERQSYIVETNLDRYFVQSLNKRVLYICKLENQLFEIEKEAGKK